MQDGAPGPAEEDDGRDPLEPLSWRELAACRGLNPAVFFPERGDTRGVEYAKSICAGCDVQVECLDENLFEDDGIVLVPMILPKEVPGSLEIPSDVHAREVTAEQERTRRQIFDLLEHVFMDFVSARAVW